MRNLRLDICYDGTRYRGWQRLPGRDDTIQGKLETALSRILEEPIEVSGSGRTDAGVHALHQVANFHCESAMPAGEILSKLRQYLPEDIGIYSCVDVPPRFHARLNARAKTYRYRIWNSRGPCVFQRRYVAVMPERLDIVGKAHEALRIGQGKHVQIDGIVGLQGVDDNLVNGHDPHKADQHEGNGQHRAAGGILFGFHSVFTHHCCTSLRRVAVCWAMARTATRIKKITAFAWATPCQFLLML